MNDPPDISGFTLKRESEIFLTIFAYIFEIMDESVSMDHILDTEINAPFKKELMSFYDKIKREGLEQGLEQGLKQGLEQGKYEKLVENIINAHKEGISAPTIARIVKVSEKQVIAILTENGYYN